MFPAAELLWRKDDDATESTVLDWIARELQSQTQFECRRTLWRGFTAPIPQVRVNTSPTPLTIQVDVDPDLDELAEVLEACASKLDEAAQTGLAQCNCVISITDGDAKLPAQIDGALQIEATTAVDPSSTPVARVLDVLALITGGFILDCVTDRMRLIDQKTWISLQS